MDLIDEIAGLLAEEEGRVETDPTSMRIPAPLRRAARLAHEHLGAPTATDMAIAGLREAIETALIRAALDAHYDHHPDTRPTIGHVAVALAAQDRHPLAEHPDQILAAADRAGDRVSTAREVLIWAEASAQAAAGSP